MGLDLDLLKTFARVAERASITAAARDLSLSKATVSKQISELEARLGISLFARTTRTLSLTDAGVSAFTRARRIMDEAEAIQEEARATKFSPRGRLKIAAPLAFARRWLGPALPSFMTAYPDIHLDFHLDDRTIDLIGEGLDAAIRIGSMPDSSFLARQIAPVRLHVVASPKYWAARSKPTHPQDLSMHCCFQYLNSPDPLWRFSGPQGQEEKVRVEGPLSFNGGEIELPALCAGLGVAVLPDFIVHEEVGKGRLETALEDWRLGELTLHLLTPPGRGRPKRLDVFSDFLVQTFGKKPALWQLEPNRS
jgi:DNA-binding transcriptional LysR family regulator